MANTVDKVLKIAEAEVGYLEKKSNSQLYDKTANAGSANYTKYGKEMHDIYPSVMDFPAAWCDAFVDWCFYKAYGVTTAKSLIGGNFNDYTPSSAQMYKNKNAWYTSNPKIGDQIFFKNSTRICHTGLVYNVDSQYVYTIEGNTNTSNGVIANGGSVCKKKYALNNTSIAGYGRPKYDVVESTQTKYTIGWSRDEKGWWYADTPSTYYKSGIFQIGNKLCYFNDAGYAVTGWFKYNNKWYYADENCYILTSQWIEDKGKNYYLLASGEMAVNCYVLSADKKTLYWIDSDGVWNSNKDLITVPSNDVVFVSK